MRRRLPNLELEVRQFKDKRWRATVDVRASAVAWVGQAEAATCATLALSP